MSGLASRLAELSPAQRELLRRRLEEKRAAGQLPEPGPKPRRIARRQEGGGDPPASLGQARLWFLDRLSAGTASYNLATDLRLRGPLEVRALAAAAAEIVRRHEALRTTFAEVGGRLVQRIAPPAGASPPLPVVDLSGLAGEEREERALALAEAALSRPLPLAHGPLHVTRLLRLGREHHLLLATTHHTVFDAWSSGIYVHELGAFYERRCRFRLEEAPPLPDPPELQYGDYAVWHHAWAESSEAREQVAFWEAALAGLPPLLELPGDRPRPPVQSFCGGSRSFAVPGLAEALKPLLRRQRASLFMALFAALQVLLWRLSGRRDLAVGSPVANRNRLETAGVIGFFVNTVCLRSALAGDPGFAALLGRARDTVLDAFAHQEAPFEVIVERLRVERSTAHNPLFQTMLVLQNTPQGEGGFGGLSVAAVDPPLRAARFDLTFSFAEQADGLEGVLDYASDLFDATTAQRWSASLVRLLEAAASDPERPVSELPLMAAAERAQVVVEWGEGTGPAPPAETLYDLFARQAGRTPELEAIAAADGGLTYGELRRRAEALAARLRELGVGPEARVGVAFDRSRELAVGVLAVLAAGGVYLPLDPAHPRRRLAELLADGGVDVSLTRGGLLADLAGLPGRWLVTDEGEELAGPPAAGRPRGGDAGPDNLAYLIYTSGSTGAPKGVMVSHRSAVNLALDFARRHGFAGQRVLVIPPLVFDASVGDLFAAWSSGATVVVHPSPGELSARDLARYCAAERVTGIDAPAALWSRWVEEWTSRGERGALPDLWLMMIGGEAVPLERVRAWQELTRDRPVPLFNHYGPTEGTVYAATERVVGGSVRPPAPRAAVLELPIGRPVDNVRVHLLDDRLRPLPAGVAGEVCLGGVGVSRGYHRRPAQTAETFVPDPLSRRPGERLYRTGDLARHLADGRLAFLGRADQQVKIGGFRIEPAEIEAALGELPGVRGAAVVVHEAKPRDYRLVAYVAGPEPADPAAWAKEAKGLLAGRLPPYMVPAALVPLAELPLTGNGKLDRRALPPPPPALLDRDRVAPRNPTEEALVRLWAEAIGQPISEVGVEDDFFALGGSSLATISLLTRVRETLAVDLPLATIFQAPTPERFAERVDRARAGGPPAVEVDWDREAALPAEIDPAGLPAAVATGEARRLLLTGATGFLGAYLLAELLTQSTAEIVCLARAGSDEEAAGRVRDNLELYGLWRRYELGRPEIAGRIVPLAGDLAAPRLGLSEGRFAELGGEVEAVVHNGGAVHFIAPYERLKATNVGGTLEILRLATRQRTKPVHFVSTLGLFLVPSRLGATVREADPVPAGAEEVGGYNQSKWVAERLVAAAGRRGLPVAVYRPARITGDSRTGACNPGDLLYTWMKGSAELGAVPNPEETLDMAPVDFVGRAIVHLALDAAPGGRFHFFNPATLPVATMAERLRAMGYGIRELRYPAWLAELRRAVAEPEGNALAPFLALYRDDVDDREPSFDCRATFDTLARAGIVCPPADARLLDVYLRRLAEDGHLPPPVPADAEVAP